MKPSLTLDEIIRRAEMQLAGIGLDDDVRAEAIAELEADLERYAGEALFRVLARHIAPLQPSKKPRKSSRSAVSSVQTTTT